MGLLTLSKQEKAAKKRSKKELRKWKANNRKIAAKARREHRL